MAGWIYCKRAVHVCQVISAARVLYRISLKKYDIPGVAGIDTRALTKILREKGTMNGMITTNENYNLDEIIPKLKAYTTGNVVDKVTCTEKKVLKGQGKSCPHGFRCQKQHRQITQ